MPGSTAIVMKAQKQVTIQSRINSNDVKAELTVTERAGFHRYTFPEAGEKNLIINLGFAINWDKTYKSSLNLVNDTLVTGSRLSQDGLQISMSFLLSDSLHRL